MVLYDKTLFVRSKFSIKFQLDCHGFPHLLQGSLTNGIVFDSSFERGDPIEFEIHSGQVIKVYLLGFIVYNFMPAITNNYWVSIYISMLLMIRKIYLSCLWVSEVDIYLKYANKTLYAKTPFVRSEFSISRGI